MSSSTTANKCMQTSEEWFITHDGVRHFYRHWRMTADGPIIIYIHGIESHSGWFENTAHSLAENGCHVYALDRRGSGRSSAPRGHIKSYKRFILDIEEFIHFTKKNQPYAPCFLIANCWGAKLAVVLAARNREKLNGLILISPAIAVKIDVDLQTKIKIGLNYICGGKKLFDLPLQPHHFTDQVHYLKFINDDPYRLKKVSAAFLVENIKLSILSRIATKHLSLPLLILQSGRDEIVDVESVQNWFNKVVSKDKTMKILTNAAHSLDFDPDIHRYQNFLQQWIIKHLDREK